MKTELFFEKYRKKILSFLVLILVIFAAGASYEYIYIPSPRHSLSLIEQAAKDGDTATFADMVDGARLSGSIFDAMTKHASWQSREPQLMLKLALGPLESEFSMSGNTYLKCLAAHDKESIDYVATKTTLESRLKALGFPLTLDYWKYVSASHFNKIDDNTAQADLTLHNDRIDADVTCTVTMERIDSKRWRIIGVTDFESFLSQVDKAYEKNLTFYNKPIQEKIDAAVKITGLESQIIHDDKNSIPRSYLRINYTLQYTDKANSIKGIRIIYELKEKDTGKILYQANTILPPSGKNMTKRISQFLLNPIIPSQYAVAQLENLDATTSTIKIIAVYYTDGTNVQISDVLPQ